MNLKKTVLRLTAGLILGAAVYSNSASARPANCTLIVNSTIIFQGTCEFIPLGDNGSFQVLRGNVFADVQITEPGMAVGNWTGPGGARHAHNPLGMLKRDFRDPACWANNNARVCAR